MTELATPPTVAESLAPTSTTSTSFQQKTSITLVANTDYLIYFTAEFDIGNSDRPAEIKLELNNTTVLRRYTVPGGTTSVDQWRSFEGSFVIELGPTAGPTIDMDYRMIISFGAGDFINVRNARIIAYELVVV